MINPLTEMALEELESGAEGPDGERALALIGRYRAGAATVEDLQLIREHVARITAEVVKASELGLTSN